MYFHEMTYNLCELFSQNLHIHTTFSGCAKPEMLVEAIMAEAERCGLTDIALVDHIQGDEEQKLAKNLPVLQKEVKELRTSVRVMVGAELSAYGVGLYSLKDNDSIQPEYRLYAHNHYHVKPWEHPEDPSPGSYKEHCKKVLRSVLVSGKADCIAHPFTDDYVAKFFPGDQKGVKDAMTSLWTENELGDLLTLGKQHEVAFELNMSSLLSRPDFARKYFRVGKEVGAVFNIGTDAHQLHRIDTFQFLEEFSRMVL